MSIARVSSTLIVDAKMNPLLLPGGPQVKW